MGFSLDSPLKQPSPSQLYSVAPGLAYGVCPFLPIVVRYCSEKGIVFHFWRALLIAFMEYQCGLYGVIGDDDLEG